MTLLHPWALALLGVAPVILLLYLLRTTRRTASVSTTRFWLRALEERTRHRLFRTLRNPLSLLLHLLILTLLALAAAQPVRRGADPRPSRSAIVIDNRLPSQQVSPNTQRPALDHAIATARRLAASASPSHPIALLAAHPTATILAPLSPNPAPLLAALDALEPTDAGGDLQPAVDLALEIASGSGPPQNVTLLSPRPIQPRAGVRRIAPPSAPESNTAIAAFAIRKPPHGGDLPEALLRVRHSGSRPATGNAILLAENRTLDVRPFHIQPQSEWAASFPLAPPPDAREPLRITARLDLASGPDSLAADNVAHAVAPASRPLRVLLVSPGDRFLEAALAADRDLRLELLRPDAFQPELSAGFDATVLDRLVPPGLDPASPPGNLLFIGAAPFNRDPSPATRPPASAAAPGHPILASTRVPETAFFRAIPLDPPPPPWAAETILAGGDRPILLAATRPNPGGPESRIALFGFSTADSALPLRASFPILLNNTIRWLANPAPPESPPLAAGDFSPEPLSPGPTLQPLRAGFYATASGDPVAVNPATPPAPAADDADARPAPPDDHPPATALPRRRMPSWQWIAAAAFALLVLEWALHHMRYTE